MKKVYKSPGMIWEEGEIPCCDYCGKSAKKVQLYETFISGGICCDSDECRLRLAEEAIEGMIELEEDDEN